MLTTMNRINITLICISVTCFVFALVEIESNSMRFSTFLFSLSYVILAMQSLNTIYVCHVLAFSEYNLMEQLHSTEDYKVNVEIEKEIKRLEKEIQINCNKFDEADLDIDCEAFQKVIDTNTAKIEALQMVLDMKEEEDL